MHLIITDPWLAKRNAVHLTGLQLAVFVVIAVVSLIFAALASYHFVFLHGARQGWPVIAPLAQLIASAERSSQERYLRENLDAMARKLGELQARVVQMDALGERVATMAGLPASDTRARSGAGGALVMPSDLTVESLRDWMDATAQHSSDTVDWLTVIETRLFDEKLKKSMVPSEHPVKDVSLGSGFGWRIDPLTGQRALHTGVDFPADTGTPILAAAGGVVVTQEYHPAYGHMLEIDHGNELITRYAHASRTHVKVGDIVKRGQKIADIGSSGRSTGPHLHFEVWLSGAVQDPMKFFQAGQASQDTARQAAPAARGLQIAATPTAKTNLPR
jgi:murein DD-endopeptidase MepM/ murein hydrolase activator NlpD